MRNVRMSEKAQFAEKPAPFALPEPDAPKPRSCVLETVILAAIVFVAVFSLAMIF